MQQHVRDNGRWREMLCGIALTWSISSGVTAADAQPQAVTFEGHILPIFKARCVRCHAGAEPQAGLRLRTDCLYSIPRT